MLFYICFSLACGTVPGSPDLKGSQIPVLQSRTDFHISTNSTLQNLKPRARSCTTTAMTIIAWFATLPGMYSLSGLAVPCKKLATETYEG